jgi:stearoyl-CoA desaturase (delta-9 desaturase)
VKLYFDFKMEAQVEKQPGKEPCEKVYFSKTSHDIVTDSYKGMKKTKLAYRIIVVTPHIFGVIGIALLIQGKVLLSTVIFAAVLGAASMFGVTAGAHRLWSHRSYSAKTPLKILLATLQTFSAQDSVWQWAAWHRVHHKFVDADGDPHNSSRGFFFSHVGWLLSYEYKDFHPYVQKVDLSDLEADPIVMFTENYALYLQLLVPFIIPALIPWYFFGEPLFNSFCVACLRVMCTYHSAFFINSAAHMWGSKPYDKSIQATENKFVAVVAFGEGWHNYHHVFPWDYKASEFGRFRWNFSAAFIDFFAWIGWAYNLKTVSRESVLRRAKRTGNYPQNENTSWGWGDTDTPEENILQTETTFAIKPE